MQSSLWCTAGGGKLPLLSLSLSLSLLHSQSVTTIFIIQPSIAPHQLPGQAWIMSTGKLVHHSFLSLLYISSFIEIFNCGVWEARKCWINSTQVRRLLFLHLHNRPLSLFLALFIQDWTDHKQHYLIFISLLSYISSLLRAVSTLKY